MRNIAIPKQLMQGINPIIEQMPGYFLWKDMNSVYLMGCSKTARLFGFEHADDLNGITDYSVRCEMAEYGDLFVKQDEKVKKEGTPLLILDVHPYINNEIKTLLINKSLLKNENGIPIGISCHCIEVDNQILNDVAFQLSKVNPRLTNKKNIRKAANYYLNSQYQGLSLSKRQSECLFYLMRGKSARMIASLLGLSTRTIEAYIEEVKNKMRCATKSEVIEKAIERGYLEIIPQSIIGKKLSNTLVNG